MESYFQENVAECRFWDSPCSRPSGTRYLKIPGVLVYKPEFNQVIQYQWVDLLLFVFVGNAGSNVIKAECH